MLGECEVGWESKRVSMEGRRRWGARASESRERIG